MFRAGANACFAKLGTCDILIKSLELVMLGETILPSAMLLPLILEKNEPLISPKFMRVRGTLHILTAMTRRLMAMTRRAYQPVKNASCATWSRETRTN